MKNLIIIETKKDSFSIENTILGKGGFGIVYLGKKYNGDNINEKYNNQDLVAIKKIDINKDVGNNIDFIEKINIEINVMKDLNHHNIVGFLDFIKIDDYYYIIMEYCDGGTLNDVILFNSTQKMSDYTREINTLYYMDQLKEAVIYLRVSGYIHRDIKPFNILIKKPIYEKNYETTENNYMYTEKFTVKLGDFGFAKKFTDDSIDMSNTICGSPLYMAPEMIIENKYDQKIDLWAYGIILYQMLYGKIPYEAKSIAQLIDILKNKQLIIDQSKKYSEEVINLMISLLRKNPINRIEWIDFTNHNWFVKTVNFEEKNNYFSLSMSKKSEPIQINCQQNSKKYYSENNFDENNFDEKKKITLSTNITRMGIEKICLNNSGVFKFHFSEENNQYSKDTKNSGTIKRMFKKNN